MHIDSLLQENIQNINFARRIWGNQYRSIFKSLLAYDLSEKTVGQQSADCWPTVGQQIFWGELFFTFFESQFYN